MLRVAVVGAPEERKVVIGPPFRLRRGIGDERAVRVVGEIEAAGPVEALDGCVRVYPES